MAPVFTALSAWRLDEALDGGSLAGRDWQWTDEMLIIIIRQLSIIRIVDLHLCNTDTGRVDHFRMGRDLAVAKKGQKTLTLTI